MTSRTTGDMTDDVSKRMDMFILFETSAFMTAVVLEVIEKSTHY